jgi:pyruvate dehydrogenase E2 component (dihydrolipoamide acetyltransferase)
MAVVVEMPKLSDTMEEGGIAAWHKKVGEMVEEGDLLLEIETDKATMEYESPEEGILLRIVKEAGSKSALNAPIAVLGEEGEGDKEVDAALAAFGGGASSSAAASDSSHAAPSDSAPAASPAPASPSTSVASSPAASGKRIKASPLAKKIAASKGIDLSTVAGSGPAGRVVKRDLDGAAAGSSASAAVSSGTFVAASAIAAASAMGAGSQQADQKLPVNMMRSTIAKRLTSAKNDAPHFYLNRSVNMKAMLDWRKDLNANKQEEEPKVSVNDLVVMAVAKSLRLHPAMNVSWQGDHILQKGSVHVAIAVGTDAGLVTPVIPNTDMLGVRQIAGVARELIGKVKRNEQVDYTSGTFTISNLGMFGIEEFTAIINPPQGAILAVGAAVSRPWANEKGEVEVQPRMSMTLSCDHRVIDGVVGAKYLQTLARFLENPLTMLA